MRKTAAALAVATMFILLGYSAGQANDRAEAVLTATLTSADHELQEGYFSLGDDATLMVKPGSELHRFLLRQRNKEITLRLSQPAPRELSRLQR